MPSIFYHSTIFFKRVLPKYLPGGIVVEELNKRFVFSGAMHFARPAGAKMEAGVNPARSRHCKEGILLSVPLLSGMKPAREGE